MEPRVCPSCGEANPPRARLCGICSTPLVEDEAAKALRRFVTVVTSDLKGSTALGEKLDVESLREVVSRYFAAMTAVFESHGGKIEKIIGDAIVAVYGLPFQHEDDPLRAVAAAFESMEALARLNDELEAIWGVRLVTRTGVATGFVEFGKESAGQRVLAGETMKVSTAMEQNCIPLRVLIADSTYQLVKDHVDVEPHEPASPKGSDEAYECHTVVSVSGGDSHDQDATPDPTPGMRICPSCGEESPERYVTCNTCGAGLAVRQIKETRRTVSIVFADPKPRTATGEPLSGEVTREVMPVYFDAMKAALERHGGTVEKFIGDAVMAVFGLPVRHEDDAVRAVRAAWDMQAALPALNARFKADHGVEFLNAIGVNTGEVIAGDALTGQRLVSGDTVNTAARLEQAAGPAEIILGPLTNRLAADQVEVEAIPPLTLKGKAEPFPAFRLVKVREQPAERAQAATPFVGRETELQRLRESLVESAMHRRAALVTVVGDGGVGKTRLLREFSDQAGRTAGVVRGRCLTYGDGVTYWPVREIVRNAAGILDEDSRDAAIAKIADLVRGSSDSDTTTEEDAIAERVAAAIGLSDTPFPSTELFWAVRRLLEAMASRRPLVVVVDDIHAAAPTFLELVDHVLDTSRSAPILVVAVGRRELLENHADWSEAHADGRVELGPLSSAQTDQLIDRILGGLDTGVRDRIVEAGAGNPLYIEQITSMLMERGTIRREGDRWVATGSADQISVPPTVEALVASRLDALAAEERQVIEPASVIGLSFPHEALVELVEDPVRPELDVHLGGLTAKQLLRPDDGVIHRFAHNIVKDTAYGGLLKRTRAALHEAFVDWAEPVNRERGREIEFEEILGYHLEQAFRYRTELGTVDDTARRVGVRAAEKLSSAGLRASTRGDLPSAVNLLRRSVALLPDTSPRRIELQVELADGLLQQGLFDDGGTVLDAATAMSAQLGEDRLAARARLLRISLDLFSGAGGGGSAALEAAAAVRPALEAAGDHAGLARAWRLTMQTEVMLGHFEEASTAAAAVVEHASRVGDRRLASRSATTIAYILVHGPRPVAEAVEQCRELLASVEGDRKVEAVILGALAQLEAMAGRLDAARAQYRQGQQILAELGAGIDLHSTAIDSGRVEILAGDLEGAERELRRDETALAELGETYFRSTIAAVLAQVLWRLGRMDEAAAYAAVAEEIGDAEDVLTQVPLKGVRAKLLARDGSGAEALALAQEAVDLAADTADVELQADAWTDLGEVSALVSGRESSGPPLREALERYRRKGDVASVARVERLLAADEEAPDGR